MISKFSNILLSFIQAESSLIVDVFSSRTLNINFKSVRNSKNLHLHPRRKLHLQFNIQSRLNGLNLIINLFSGFAQTFESKFQYYFDFFQNNTFFSRLTVIKLVINRDLKKRRNIAYFHDVLQMFRKDWIPLKLDYWTIFSVVIHLL